MSKVGALLCGPNFNWTSFWKSKRVRGKHADFTLNRKRVGRPGFKWGPNRRLPPWEAAAVFSADISDSPLTTRISQQGRLAGRLSGYLKVLEAPGTTCSYESRGNGACCTPWSTRLGCVLDLREQRQTPLPHTTNASNNSTRKVAEQKRRVARVCAEWTCVCGTHTSLDNSGAEQEDGGHRDAGTQNQHVSLSPTHRSTSQHVWMRWKHQQLYLQAIEVWRL